MSTTTERFEAAQRRDVKRMTKEELSALAAMLRLAAASLDEAQKYEKTSHHHPVALKFEEQAEAQFDAAILYFAKVRGRVEPGPTMHADGSIA